MQSLLRFRIPPPQVLVHSVHSDQSVQAGQVSSLQSSLTSLSPTHPSTLLGSTHSLTLLLFPPPQVLVHWVHSVQSVQTGHSWSLQVSVNSLSPVHCRPLRVRTHSLNFVLVPPPQDLVQGLHLVQ